eukprot:scaffold12647_cov101-Isochrysis_galbana.AAC.2
MREARPGFTAILSSLPLPTPKLQGALAATACAARHWTPSSPRAPRTAVAAHPPPSPPIATAQSGCSSVAEPMCCPVTSPASNPARAQPSAIVPGRSAQCTSSPHQRVA